MAKPGFYNDNRNRHYPFLKNTVGDPGGTGVKRLPDSAVVDCGVLVGLSAGFVDGTHAVWLDAVRRAGGRLYFDLASDAPGLYQRRLTFSRPVAGWARYDTEHAADTPEPPPAETVSESATISECGPVQFGTSGTYVPACTGRLRLFFNDDYFDDNTGGPLRLTIAGQTYDVPIATNNGTDGPWVVKGTSYPYTATGTVTYRQAPHLSNATANGTVSEAPKVADQYSPVPGLAKWSLVGKLFAETVTHYTVSDSAAACDPEPAWSGFLVTGDLGDLLAILTADGQQLTRAGGGDAVLEPALAQNLGGGYVASVNLANDDRTRVDAPDECPPTQWPYPTGPNRVFVSAACLRGDLRFSAGYNAVVRQDDAANAIVIGAAVGAGAGEPCGEVPLFPGEGPPPGSTLLTGGPACNQVVRTINGVGGQFSSIVSGLGVRVDAVPEDATVVVDVDMRQLAVCYSDGATIVVSEGA
jgi:hypothetical protein